MGQVDMMNAAVLGGLLRPIKEKFKDAEKRGIIGRFTVVPSPVQYKENRDSLLFGHLLGSLLDGLLGISSTKSILDLGNTPSQLAVDSYLKVYTQFCEIIGRKGKRGECDDEYTKFSCKVFQSNLARLALAMPMTDGLEKPRHAMTTTVNGKNSRVCTALSPKHWRTFLTSLMDSKGPGYKLRVALESLGSSGGQGKTDLWKVIVDSKLVVEADSSVARTGRVSLNPTRMVVPDSNLPSRVNPELLEGGESSPVWRGTVDVGGLEDLPCDNDETDENDADANDD